MRIGINLLYLMPGVNGGTETYAAGLLHGLARVAPQDEFVIFVTQDAVDWSIPDASNFRRVVCPVSARHKANQLRYEQMEFSRILRREKIDLLHSLGYQGPLHSPCPTVLTVPDTHWRSYGRSSLRRFIQNEYVKQCVRRANHVITISEFSRREILSAFRPPQAKVSVTYLAPRLRGGPMAESGGKPAPATVGASPPYAVAFSSSAPNKNIPRLIEAFARARHQHGLCHQLVIVGHLPKDCQLGSPPPWLVLTGYLSEDRLEALLRAGEMLVFPSIYEGFGLPVLEAMELGLPVVCSTAAALLEVAGDAACFFDPYSIEGMGAEIARVAANPSLRDELRRRGQANLQRFSWEATASQTARIYHELHGKPDGSSSVAQRGSSFHSREGEAGWNVMFRTPGPEGSLERSLSPKVVPRFLP